MKKSNEFQFHCPLKIMSGQVAASHLPFELRELGVDHPLIVHSRHLCRQVDYLAGGFRDTGMTVGIFSGIDTGAPGDAVEKLVSCFRKFSHDALIVVGGEPTVNRVRLARLRLAGVDLQEKEPCAASGALSPMVYVATPEAMGTEVCGVAFDRDAVCVSTALMPDIAVIDPAMLERCARKDEIRPVVETVRILLDDTLAPETTNPITHAYRMTALELLSVFYLRWGGQGNISRDSLEVLNNAAAIAACVLPDMAGSGFTVLHPGDLGREAGDFNPGPIKDVMVELRSRRAH